MFPPDYIYGTIGQPLIIINIVLKWSKSSEQVIFREHTYIHYQNLMFLYPFRLYLHNHKREPIFPNETVGFFPNFFTFSIYKEDLQILFDSSPFKEFDTNRLNIHISIM